MSNEELYNYYQNYFLNPKVKNTRFSFIVEMRRQIIIELREFEKGQKNRFWTYHKLKDMFGFKDHVNVMRLEMYVGSRIDIVEEVKNLKYDWIVTKVYPIKKNINSNFERKTWYKLENL